MERSSKDGRGRSCLSEASGEGVKDIVETRTERPCWTRIGSGVPLCETCTASIAGRGVPASLEEEEEGGEDSEDDDNDGEEGQIVREDASL